MANPTNMHHNLFSEWYVIEIAMKGYIFLEIVTYIFFKISYESFKFITFLSHTQTLGLWCAFLYHVFSKQLPHKKSRLLAQFLNSYLTWKREKVVLLLGHLVWVLYSKWRENNISSDTFSTSETNQPLRALKGFYIVLCLGGSLCSWVDI